MLTCYLFYKKPKLTLWRTKKVFSKQLVAKLVNPSYKTFTNNTLSTKYLIRLNTILLNRPGILMSIASIFYPKTYTKTFSLLLVKNLKPIKLVKPLITNKLPLTHSTNTLTKYI